MQIVMDEKDFERLSHIRMDWAAYAEDVTNDRGHHPGWRSQICGGRFEVNDSAEELPSLHWRWAYWVGVNYTAVILARSFLNNRGQDCQIVWDLAENPDPSWVILTDYGPES